MNTLAIITPLAIICLFGYVSVRFKLFNQQQMNAINAVCFNLLIPIFLFLSTYKTDLSAQLSLGWFLSFYLPVTVVYLTSFLGYRFIQRQTNKSSALAALSATYSNTVLIAIPIIGFYLTDAGLAYILIAFHSALLFCLTELLVVKTSYKSLLRTLKNPIVLSIFSGFIFNGLNIPISPILIEPLEKLSLSAIPLALFTLGASLYFLPFKGNRTLAVVNSVIKLLVLPAAVYVTATWVFNLSPQQTFIAVILAASPLGVGAFIMANKYQQNQQLAASTVVISTLMCSFSYLLWIELLL